jgi:DsbC/DsbD-like thiol-disulfide interchange protein
MSKKFSLLFTSILSFSLVFFSNHGFAQTGSAKQVTLSQSAKKIGDKKYEVTITANISGDFHLYAQDAGAEGPVPTTIKFQPNPLLTLVGKTTERGKKISKMEKVWGGKVNYYDKSVTFVQVVVAKTNAKTSLNGTIEFMVCNDEVCLPPSELPLKIAIGG